MKDAPLHIVGAPGSPYSRKLRAVLRYRRIPHVWVQRGSREARALPRPRVELLPQLVAPGLRAGGAHRLDAPDPAAREPHRRALGDPRPIRRSPSSMRCSRTTPTSGSPRRCSTTAGRSRPTSRRRRRSCRAGFASTSRRPRRWPPASSSRSARSAGSAWWARTRPPAPTIEASYRRLLGLLDARLSSRASCWARGPAPADFALYGQLTQLAGFDPTPRRVALELAPRVVAWVDVVEDLSGLEPSDGDWLARDALPATLRALFGEVGRVYAPFLLANADALARGAERVECTIDGRPWVQKPFPYQGKCLAWLREAHAALAASDRRAVDAFLAGTGCEALFTQSLLALLREERLVRPRDQVGVADREALAQEGELRALLGLAGRSAVPDRFELHEVCRARPRDRGGCARSGRARSRASCGRRGGRRAAPRAAASCARARARGSPRSPSAVRRPGRAVGMGSAARPRGSTRAELQPTRCAVRK